MRCFRFQIANTYLIRCLVLKRLGTRRRITATERLFSRPLDWVHFPKRRRLHNHHRHLCTWQIVGTQISTTAILIHIIEHRINSLPRLRLYNWRTHLESRLIGSCLSRKRREPHQYLTQTWVMKFIYLSKFVVKGALHLEFFCNAASFAPFIKIRLRSSLARIYNWQVREKYKINLIFCYAKLARELNWKIKKRKKKHTHTHTIDKLYLWESLLQSFGLNDLFLHTPTWKL